MEGSVERTEGGESAIAVEYEVGDMILSDGSVVRTEDFMSVDDSNHYVSGFLLKSQQERIGLSNEFFQICKNWIGHSKRYLTKDYKEGKYDTAWRLVVPEQMNYLKNEGVRYEL